MLRLSGVTKRYRSGGGIADLDLELGKGQILGLLGPNGAGKTTTIRLALGLIRADAGAISVHGQPVGRHPPGSVGYMPDAPHFYGSLSARANLEIMGTVAGRDDPSSIDIGAALDLVSLPDSGQPVRTFSRGMLQRLSLANAISLRPQLFVLDEPTAALDVAGARMVRDLIHSLRDEGRSILVSSHRLYDLEGCDSAMVIARGRRAFLGPLSDLATDRGTRVRVTQATAAMDAFRERGWTTTSADADLIVAGVTPEQVAAALSDAGLVPTRLTTHERTLEDAYLDLVARVVD